MSPIQACKGCGGLFAYLPRGLCADCLDVREERFRVVREWLIDNRGASIAGAAAATGIEEALIASFIREGRLEFIAASSASVQEIRGQDALRNRIVDEMAAQLAAQTGSVPPTADARRAAGMRSRLP